MIEIDGSQGEGGGQIIRSSIALSLLTCKPVVITNIRAGRKKSGLRQQHLTAVNAAAKVGQAKLEGAAVGASCLSFEPSTVTSGEYSFRVGTAGSTTLVLQTILPALLLTGEPSTLILEGGTHNPFAPPFEFLANAYLPLVNRMGPNVAASLTRPGFYPAGGGQFSVQVRPAERLKGFELHERGNLRERTVKAIVSKLPTHIAKRECDTIARKSGWEKKCFKVEESVDSIGFGNVVLVQVQFDNITEVFVGFGKVGLKAERVATNVWKDASKYLSSDVPVGPYLADQLLLPFGIAAHQGSSSSFRTSALTDHSTTHIEVLRQFLDIEVDVKECATNDLIVELRQAQK